MTEVCLDSHSRLRGRRLRNMRRGAVWGWWWWWLSFVVVVVVVGGGGGGGGVFFFFSHINLEVFKLYTSLISCAKIFWICFSLRVFVSVHPLRGSRQELTRFILVFGDVCLGSLQWHAGEYGAYETFGECAIAQQNFCSSFTSHVYGVSSLEFFNLEIWFFCGSVWTLSDWTYSIPASGRHIDIHIAYIYIYI